jgi:ATP-dependent Zn protease
VAASAVLSCFAILCVCASSTSDQMTESYLQGHVQGKHPALRLDNVVIARDKIGFTLQTDMDKHEIALKDKKIPTDDVSVQTTSKRVYTVKPSASQELMDLLRNNAIPFRAASVKGANTAGSIARFGILMVYLLFLRRMYQVMGGQGDKSGPGKLATFNNNEPLVKFEDIEGIDDAKFEVMELVDTLRNPKKYEVSLIILSCIFT